MSWVWFGSRSRSKWATEEKPNHRPRYASAYTEDQIVEQPGIELFAKLGWQHRRTRDLLLPRLLSGRLDLNTN